MTLPTPPVRNVNSKQSDLLQEDTVALLKMEVGW